MCYNLIMTHKTENCLDVREILPESVYLSGDPSGMARGVTGSLAPLGWTSIFSIFSGLGASNRGKAIASLAGKCQDLTAEKMGQVQRVRGWVETLCGFVFIPIRFSQTVTPIKAAAFIPLLIIGLSVGLVLYSLLAIPLLYRIYLRLKIDKQVAQMKPQDRLAFYEEQLKVDLEPILETVKAEIPTGKPIEKPFEDSRLESVVADALEEGYVGVHYLDPGVLAEKVARVFQKIELQRAFKRMQLGFAFGPDAIKVIEHHEGLSVGEALKKIDSAKGLYIAILAVGVISTVIGLGVFAYSMDMGGLAIIQNYGLLAGASLFLICDLYGVIQSLKHSDLKKEKCLTLALTALVFTAALVTFLHQGNPGLVGNALFYTVLSFWALQMIVLFSAAAYKRWEERRKEAEEQNRLDSIVSCE